MIPFKMHLPVDASAGRIEMNGEEVKGLRSAAVKHEVGDVPRVYLEFIGEATIDGEGIVTIVKDLDQRQAVVEWLANLDGAELDKEVLERATLSSAVQGDVYLAVLQEWVSGEHRS